MSVDVTTTRIADPPGTCINIKQKFREANSPIGLSRTVLAQPAFPRSATLLNTLPTRHKTSLHAFNSGNFFGEIDVYQETICKNCSVHCVDSCEHRTSKCLSTGTGTSSRANVNDT